MLLEGLTCKSARLEQEPHVALVEPLAKRTQRGQALGRFQGLHFIEQRLALRPRLLRWLKIGGCFHEGD